MIKMAGSMESSTEVMKAMAKVIKLPEIRKNMMDMAREMHKVLIYLYVYVYVYVLMYMYVCNTCV